MNAARLGMGPGAGSEIQRGAGSSAAAAREAKMVTAAHQFEASLMQELLRPLQQDSLFAEGGSAGGDGAGQGGALMDFASEALGRAISEHGGLGIARKVLEHLEHRSPGIAGSGAANEHRTKNDSPARAANAGESH